VVGVDAGAEDAGAEEAGAAEDAGADTDVVAEDTTGGGAEDELPAAHPATTAPAAAIPASLSNNENGVEPVITNHSFCASAMRGPDARLPHVAAYILETPQRGPRLERDYVSPKRASSVI
jgi:hypothetical protein